MVYLLAISFVAMLTLLIFGDKSVETLKNIVVAVYFSCALALLTYSSMVFLGFLS